jgi:hypothetical protein
MKRLLFALIVLALSTLAQAQAVRVERLASDQISVTAYDDNAHGRIFGLTDPNMKRMAMVVTNNTERPVMATVVVWTWTRADGKPGQLLLEGTNFGHPFPAIAAYSSVMMVPGQGAVAPGPGRGRGQIGGILHVPEDMQTGTNFSGSLDALILSDGQVIGPDKYNLVGNLNGRAKALDKLTTIIKAARANGRDPGADVKAAIQTEPDPIVKRQMIDSSAGGQIVDMAHNKLELPRFYRK